MSSPNMNNVILLGALLAFLAITLKSNPLLNCNYIFETFLCRYIRMSSPNMNNVILLGALLAFLAMIFGGADSVVKNSQLMLICCKVYEIDAYISKFVSILISQ